MSLGNITYFLQALDKVNVDPSAKDLALASSPPNEPSLHKP